MMFRRAQQAVAVAWLIAGFVGEWPRQTAANVTVTSPGGNITATIWIDGASKLQYDLTRDGKTVLETSPLGITVDTVDLGSGVVGVTASAPAEVNSSYPWRGVKSIAVNHYNQITLQ